MSYLSIWWEVQPSAMRDAFAALVRNGQLEIVTGGWVMADEATTHYSALLAQLIEGHQVEWNAVLGACVMNYYLIIFLVFIQWLEKNIGVRPSTAWACDPFGHSPTMACVLALSNDVSVLSLMHSSQLSSATIGYRCDGDSADALRGQAPSRRTPLP
jgi:alpha-mannosidase II